MSNPTLKNVIKIIKGSYKKFTLFMEDEENSTRLDLSGFTAGKIIIPTGASTKLEKTITVPGASPKTGEIEIELLSTETDQLDPAYTNIETELTDGSGNVHVFLGENFLEIKERQ